MRCHEHAVTTRGQENNARGTDVLDLDVVLMTANWAQALLGKRKQVSFDGRASPFHYRWKSRPIPFHLLHYIVAHDLMRRRRVAVSRLLLKFWGVTKLSYLGLN